MSGRPTPAMTITTDKPKSKSNHISKNNKLPDDELVLFFSVLRFVSQHKPQPHTPLQPPSVTQVPSTDNGSSTTAAATSSACKKDSSTASSRGGATGSCSPGQPSSTASRASTGVSSLRSNRLEVPETVVGPLEDFRMASTNFPIDDAAIVATRGELQRALFAAYRPHVAELTQLFMEATSGVLRREEELAAAGTGAAAAKGTTGGMQSMQEILPGLYCGSYHPAAKLETLQAAHITHILCCIGTAPRFPGEFMYMTIPADDRPDYNIAQHFDRTFDFIESATVREGKSVLVHCGAGISRAPTIVAAYLIRKLRMTPGQAVAFVQRRRPFASPNTGFLTQLRTYAKELHVIAGEASNVDDVTAEHDTRIAAAKAIQTGSAR